MTFKRLAIRFIPTFLAFPIGGELVVLSIGPVRSSSEALLSGAIVGLVLGLIQFIALCPLKVSSLWIWTTLISAALSSFVVASLFGLNTDSASLALRGLVTGLFVGAAQSFSQRVAVQNMIVWSFATGLTWALAWFITSMVIVDIEYGYAIFGASGALVATLILTFVVPRVITLEAKN